MNLIFEGCDCVGKTTIAELFMRRNPVFKYIKVNNPKDKEDGFKKNTELVQTLNIQDNLLLDRGMLGECVYGPLIRGYYPEYMRDLESKLTNNTHLVLLFADVDDVLKRFDGKFITRDQIPKILDYFVYEYERSRYKNKIRINTSTHDPLNAVLILERWLYGASD